MACIEKQGPPPRELVWYWNTQFFKGTLPEAGGQWDQPAGLLHRIRTVGNVYEVMKRWHGGSWIEFEKRYPDCMPTVQMVLRLQDEAREAE